MLTRTDAEKKRVRAWEANGMFVKAAREQRHLVDDSDDLRENFLAVALGVLLPSSLMSGQKEMRWQRRVQTDLVGEGDDLLHVGRQPVDPLHVVRRLRAVQVPVPSGPVSHARAREHAFR